MDWNEIVATQINSKKIEDPAKIDDHETRFMKRVEVHLREPVGPYYFEIENQFLSGAKKQRLTHWWLELIESTVDEYLKEKNYDATAVPFHYIDQPPSSMEAIKHNLQLIRTLLDLRSHEGKEMRSVMIEPLKQMIYQEIDAFQFNSISILSTILNIDNLNCDWHQLQARFESMKPKFTPTKQKQIANMFHDLQYIFKMKELEEKFYETSQEQSDTKAPLSDIVPISGLILGRLFRLENELKTVQDHWSTRMSKK